MKPLLKLLFVWFMFAPPVAGPGSTGYPAWADDKAKTLLVLGDSISAGYGIQRKDGWVEQLKRRIGTSMPDVQVVNASSSGATTQSGLSRLPLLLETHAPEIVVVELGGNDGLRGYPTKTIRRNLERMVELSRTAGARVLLISMYIPPNYGKRYSQAFHAVFVDTAADLQVTLVPFLLEDIARHPELMQQDGIHPTREAQPIMLDTAWPYLVPLLNSLSARPGGSDTSE